MWAIAVLTIDFLVLFGLLTQSDEFLTKLSRAGSRRDRTSSAFAGLPVRGMVCCQDLAPPQIERPALTRRWRESAACGWRDHVPRAHGVDVEVSAFPEGAHAGVAAKSGRARTDYARMGRDRARTWPCRRHPRVRGRTGGAERSLVHVVHRSPDGSSAVRRHPARGERGPRTSTRTAIIARDWTGQCTSALSAISSAPISATPTACMSETSTPAPDRRAPAKP
jgi:hypothetical protein